MAVMLGGLGEPKMAQGEAQRAEAQGMCPWRHTLGRGHRQSLQEGRRDPARPRRQTEGSFQPGEELRCKRRKGRITLESVPL